ncbi:phosphodiester glycosidase family protein [Sphingomonas swuensis]|uniref:Phosphodiester glycosidase family protein n=1 Tax=Sphingomonas swuensis TaxID=977800 RepID=A0ABP7SUU3_9SPHN
MSDEGACRSLLFEGQRFTICRDPAASLEVHVAGKDNRPYRSFAALEHVLGPRAAKVRFAVNAGMFDDDGRPIGLAIAEGKELKPLNKRTNGGGNFHLQPNGVFLVRADGRAEVVTTGAYRANPSIRFATQSGPMLVIDGKVNPRFSRDGSSQYVRNGVGVDGAGVTVVAISDTPVSFGRFARLFAGPLGCRNALYLDGSVSSLWDPANARMDSLSAIGPMLVAFAS